MRWNYRHLTYLLASRSYKIYILYTQKAIAKHFGSFFSVFVVRLLACLLSLYTVRVFWNAFVWNCLVFDFQYADMIHKKPYKLKYATDNGKVFYQVKIENHVNSRRFEQCDNTRYACELANWNPTICVQREKNGVCSKLKTPVPMQCSFVDVCLCLTGIAKKRNCPFGFLCTDLFLYSCYLFEIIACLTQLSSQAFWIVLLRLQWQSQSQ